MKGILDKEKPPDFSGGFFVAGSIELSNRNGFVHDFLSEIEFLEVLHQTD